MTLLEVIDTARNLLNEPLDSTRTFPDNTSSFYTDSVLVSYFNLIQQEVQQHVVSVHEDFFVTQTYLSIVNGTAEYSLPSTFIKMKRVQDERNSSAPTEIIPVEMNERDDLARSILGSGALIGSSYYLRGNQIVLTDTPTYTNACAIRLHFIRRLDDLGAVLSNTGTASELPAEHHRCLVFGVVQCALHQQQSENGWAAQEYKRLLKDIKEQVEDRQIQRPRRVRSFYDRRNG